MAKVTVLVLALSHGVVRLLGVSRITAWLTQASGRALPGGLATAPVKAWLMR